MSYSIHTPQVRTMAGNTFVNPIFGGQDPFVIKGPDNYYYFVEGANNNGLAAVSVSKSKRLTDRGLMKIVWTASSTSVNKYDTWAPEMFYFPDAPGDKWYIYYCAGAIPGDWQSKRIGVASGNDPLGPFTDRGILNVGEYMSIDPSVLYCNNKYYLLFVRSESTGSRIFIAPMSDPAHLSGEPVMLCEPESTTDPDYWDFWVNEGPEALINPDGDPYIIYSANLAHCTRYCLAQLKCTNKFADNLADRSLWQKSGPVFSQSGNVWGPGHCAFTTSPDGREYWIEYHSKFDTVEVLPTGWNRVVNIKKFNWNADGSPAFGTPTQLGIPMALPSGEQPNPGGTAVSDDFSTDRRNWQEYNCTFSNSIEIEDGEYSIDGTLDCRYGDKAVIRDMEYTDFTLDSDLFIHGGDGNGGVIFRAYDLGCGLDIFKGYVAAFDTDGNLVFGYSDGLWHSVASVQANAGIGQWAHLRVAAEGQHFKIFVNDMNTPKIDTSAFNWNDPGYASGRVGLRAINTHIHFDKFSVTPAGI